MEIKVLKRQENDGFIYVYIARESDYDGVCVVQYTTGRVSVAYTDPVSCVNVYLRNGFHECRNSIPDRIMKIIEGRINEQVEG